MHPNEQIIQRFYTSFDQLDSQGMARCYHEEIIFSDPVFPKLTGKKASAMWNMLIEALRKNKDRWQLDFSSVQADDTEGSCHLEAHYTFSLTGRRVHNIIEAKFKFKDGKIIAHTDSFDFYRWSKMAFGLTGWLLGWMPFFKMKVRKNVSDKLNQFLTKQEET